MPYVFLLLLVALLPVYIATEYKAKSKWIKLMLKACCSLLFVLTAVSAMGLGAASRTVGMVFLAAFLLSAAGDVLLSWPMKQSFLLGLGAFFLAQCTFALAFSLRWGLSLWDIPVYLVLAGASVGTLLAAPHMEYGPMRLPVSLYAMALSAMAAKAVSGVYLSGGGWAWAAAAGGLLFYASDVILAFQLFHREKHPCMVACNLTTYYLGQALLALSMLGF